MRTTSDSDAPTPTDDELLLAVQDGRLDRLGELFERHHLRVEIEREMRGKIGGGGPEMRFETFNGSIYLRRGE